MREELAQWDFVMLAYGVGLVRVGGAYYLGHGGRCAGPKRGAMPRGGV